MASFLRARSVVLGVALTASVILLVAVPPAQAAPSEPDRQAARAGLLTAADLGPEWTATPYHASNSAGAVLGAVPQCRRIKDLAKLIAGNAPGRAKAHSPEFKSGDLQINNGTSVLPNEKVARSAIAVFSSPLFRGCMRTALNRLLQKQMAKDPKFARQVAGASVSVSPTSLSLPADEEAGLSVVMHFRIKAGPTFEENFVFDAVRIGRGLANYSIEFGLDAGAQAPVSLLLPSVQRFRAARAGAATTG
jgi:hypothetical protein